MTERERSVLRIRAAEEDGRTGDIWKDGGMKRPAISIGWAERAWKARSMFRIGAALAACGVAASLAAGMFHATDVSGQAPDFGAMAESIEDLALFADTAVFESRASLDEGYALQPRIISVDPAGPERLVEFGPEYLVEFGPEQRFEFGPEYEPGKLDEAVEEAAFEAARAAAEKAAADALEEQKRMSLQYNYSADGQESQTGNTQAAYGAMADYPVAAQVYERMSGEGWSDVCIAGLLGNMMTECGGQTLALEPSAVSVDRGVRYYGLCQWSMTYNGGVDGRDVSGQLDYLMGNVESQMAYFGGDGGTYSNWLGSSDAAQAARDFCKYYERGSGTERRAANAVTAYNWITAAKAS